MNKQTLARRKEKDIFKLMASNYKVVSSETEASTYTVQFCGPRDTPYERGTWTINLFLPEQYPFKSPCVGFHNKIYHPNIDFPSGTVCLDVINQTWTPMYELVNIFQIFLPQLLTYPNPSSPLNHQAAELFERDKVKYSKRVNEYVDKHAIPQILVLTPDIIPKVQENATPQEQLQEIRSQCSLSDRNSMKDQNEQLNMY